MSVQAVIAVRCHSAGKLKKKVAQINCSLSHIQKGHMNQHALISCSIVTS